KGTQAAVQTDVDERLGGFLVDGREHQCRRRPGGKQVLNECGVDSLGVLHVGKPRFQRKRVVLQPLLQRKIQRGTELRVLRCVEVQVHKAGQYPAGGGRTDQRAAVLRLGEQLVEPWIRFLKRLRNQAFVIDGDECFLPGLDRAADGSVGETSY